MSIFFRLFSFRFHRGFFLEAGAAILFFGALAQQTDIHLAASNALAELKVMGYQIPSEDDPVRVFPALTAGNFSDNHAGGWRPGSIYLRREPQGGLNEIVYLRHELFHEASHRSCRGLLPSWVEEAAAMRFSGELTNLTPDTWPTEGELQTLKTSVRQGRSLDGENLRVLARLVLDADWPEEPCATPPKLREQLGSGFDDAGSGGYLLMSVFSGRILESGGDSDSELPPGSLLKIPYAASLNHANTEVLAAELAASDTDKLLQRRNNFRPERYRLLLSPIKSQSLINPQNPTQAPETWRPYLGERDADGNFPLQASLPDLALTMRAALLAEPDYFKGLTQNGWSPNSTLYGQKAKDKELLRQMQALSKTGTVSTADGRPLVGHLLVAWPANHPSYLAVFRQRGINGASVLPKAVERLKSWQQAYPARFASVRIRLLTPTDPASWEARAECPEISGLLNRFTVCGRFRIVSSARGSRSERLIDGILYKPRDHGPEILETDTESYADSVLAAEAQTLTGSAREALRAVIVWNGSHGNHRHADSQSLCDTTHCMVFMGQHSGDNISRGGHANIKLLKLLDKLAAENGLNWLSFANGGDLRWKREITSSALNARFSETQVLDIRRERRKNGGLFIHLFYPDSEETMSCEIFRNHLKLPSCPDSINTNLDRSVWNFQGIGEGHGEGLAIVHAQALAEAGRTTEQILLDAYSRPPLSEANAVGRSVP